MTLEEAVVAAWAHLSGDAAQPVTADVVAAELEPYATAILDDRPDLWAAIGRRRGWRA